MTEEKDSKSEKETLVEQENIPEEIDYKKKYYYLAAEMQNIQKRFDKEKENTIKYGNEKIIKELLAVVDNLDRTLLSLDKSDEKLQNIILGIEMVHKQFLEILSKNGLKRLSSLGEEFNPNFHEALQQKESEEDEGTILEVYQEGYKLNDRLIRPAKVIVAKNIKQGENI